MAKNKKYVKAKIDDWNLMDSMLESGTIILATEEDEKKKRYLIINAGGDPIISMYYHVSEKPTPRPLMYDVLGDFFKIAEERDIKHVATKIEKLENGIFYADIEFKFGDDVKKLGSRPSDGIALALKTNADIYINEEVLEKVGKTKKEMDKIKHNTEKIVDGLKKIFTSQRPCPGCPGCVQKKNLQREHKPEEDEIMFG